MGRFTFVFPMRGRDSESSLTLYRAFLDNKRFILENPQSPHHGKPITRSQLIAAGYDTVYIRYSKRKRLIKVDLTHGT